MGVPAGAGDHPDPADLRERESQGVHSGAIIGAMRGAFGIAAALVTGVLLAVPAGLGASSAHARLYFLSATGRTLAPVTDRAIPNTPTAALAALIDGPSPRERAAGKRSPFPPGIRLTRLRVSLGTATVSFTGKRLATLRTIPRLRVIASVTYTLTRFAAIRQARFNLGTQPWGVYNHAGGVIRDYTRGTLVHPWLTACAPGDGCFAP